TDEYESRRVEPPPPPIFVASGVLGIRVLADAAGFLSRRRTIAVRRVVHGCPDHGGRDVDIRYASLDSVMAVAMKQIRDANRRGNSAGFDRRKFRMVVD